MKVHPTHQPQQLESSTQVCSMIDLPSTQSVIEESLIYNGMVDYLSELRSQALLNDEGIVIVETPPSSECLFFQNKSLDIDLWQFLKRLRDNGQIRGSTLLYTSCLLEKIQGSSPIHPQVVVKMFIGLVYISMKYLHDNDYFSLEDYSLLVGLESEDVLNIESEILINYLDWNVFVTKNHYLETRQLYIIVDKGEQQEEETHQLSTMDSSEEGDLVTGKQDQLLMDYQS